MNCFRSTLLSFRSLTPTPLLEHPKRALMKATTVALSFNLLLSSPIPSLLAAPLLPSSINTPTLCNDQHRNPLDANGVEDSEDKSSASVDAEGIVQEAWQIINDSYLDTGKRRWSLEAWQQKRIDLQGTKIHGASKAHELIKRMLGGLGDPYTRFLSRSEFSKMARYDMTGIGINLREVPSDNGEVKLMILGLLLDGPAHAAGVHQGDEILSVNGENVRGKSAFEVSTMLQGPNETSVTIEVKRGNCEGTQSFEVERQVVARTPVFYKLEQVGKNGPSVGYIRLKEFNALARKDLVIAIKRLQEMGASYFILDLRDNLGGLVQVGIEIAKLFLNKGETVIYTAGRDSQYQNTIVSDASQLVSSPLVVLVNNRTASASEIVASALHDNCRAVLVGEKTFGKGLIQSVFELHDGSGVVVTVGKYVTPNHIDINGNGLDPDFKDLPEWSKVVERLSYCSKKM